MSFKKIAITLIVLSLITSAIVGVYLWFNFRSRSNLILVIPKKVDWAVHFQTTKIRSKTTGKKAAYLDTFEKLISKLPLFLNCENPQETGLKLYSDLVLFGNELGWFAAINVNSESALENYLNTQLKSNWIDKKEVYANYSIIKAKRNFFAAYKHKAIVLFIPSDTANDFTPGKNAMDVIFSEKTERITESTNWQKLYENNADIIYLNNAKLETSESIVLEKGGIAKILFPFAKEKSAHLSPLYLFYKAGINYSEKEIGQIISKDNSIATNEYLNQCFRLFSNFVKPFSKK